MSDVSSRYQVITTSGDLLALDELEEWVNDAIREGWEPLGGICAVMLEDRIDDKPAYRYLQAMSR